MLKPLLIGGGALLVVMLAAWIVAPRWHPSDSEYPSQGIDVSHHQGAIG